MQQMQTNIKQTITNKLFKNELTKEITTAIALIELEQAISKICCDDIEQ